MEALRSTPTPPRPPPEIDFGAEFAKMGRFAIYSVRKTQESAIGIRKIKKKEVAASAHLRSSRFRRPTSGKRRRHMRDIRRHYGEGGSHLRWMPWRSHGWDSICITPGGHKRKSPAEKSIHYYKRNESSNEPRKRPSVTFALGGSIPLGRRRFRRANPTNYTAREFRNRSACYFQRVGQHPFLLTVCECVGNS